MPTNVVMDLIKRVLVLETKMKLLLDIQKWQLGLLGAILVAVLGAWVTR
jgi:hypothetical protein